jgi:hypothetical protein
MRDRGAKNEEREPLAQKAIYQKLNRDGKHSDTFHQQMGGVP